MQFNPACNKCFDINRLDRTSEASYRAVGDLVGGVAVERKRTSPKGGVGEVDRLLAAACPKPGAAWVLPLGIGDDAEAGQPHVLRHPGFPEIDQKANRF